MSEWKQLDDPELKQLIRKYLFQAVILMLVLGAMTLAFAVAFENQINSFSLWLSESFGIYGLVAIVFFTDMFVSPIPPDATLFFIGRGPFHEHWYFYVPFLGLASTAAGVVGWWIGQKLKNLAYFRKLVDYFGKEHEGSAKKFGFWVVVIGALTPVPFSLTCWFAGIFKMPLKSFVVAASFRIPRFVIYYWAIFYSGEFGSFLRSLMNF